jgi:hypothetical protein
MFSTGIALAGIAIAATVATVDNAETVKGVGVVVGWQYSVAEKPGSTLFGRAMMNVLFTKN